MKEVCLKGRGFVRWLVSMARSEEGQIEVDREVKCDRYKGNVTRKTRRRRKCARKERRKEKKGQERIKGQKKTKS